MSDKSETIILIHGLWMRGLVMLPHQHWLRSEGFSVCRFSYPSWRGSLADNVRLLSTFVKESPCSSIHLVAHSLGGAVALTMLSQEPDPRIRRVILMGTPYAGCHCGFAIAKRPMLARLVGHTFEGWFKIPRPTLPPAVDIGILAGTRSISCGRLIPGLACPNDGLIAVTETYIPAAKDSISLHVSHSGMLVSKACAGQIANFLRFGIFLHA